MSHPLLLVWLLLAFAVGLGFSSSSSLATFNDMEISYRDDCAHLKVNECEKPDVNNDSSGQFESLTCKQNKMFEAPENILYRDKSKGSERLFNGSPHIWASCLPKCISKYRLPALGKCAASDTQCRNIIYGVDKSEIICEDETRTLVVNGIPVKSALKCDEKKGYSDTHKDAKATIFDFSTAKDPVLEYFCHENCVSTNVKSSCVTGKDGITCLQPSFDGSDNTIKCPASDGDRPVRLLINSRLYESAKCSRTGWRGTKISTNSEEFIIDLMKDPLETIEANCHILCDKSMIVNICETTENCRDAKPEFKNATTLTCPEHFFLKVDDVIYKELVCSEKGLSGSGKLLVDYATYPLQKLRVKCLPYCDNSMVVDVCPGKCGAKPEYTAGKLTCSPETDYELLVGGVPRYDVTCSAKGWETSNPPNILVDSSDKVNKIKAYCRKRITPVEITAPPPSTTPPPPATDCTGSSEARKDGGNEGVSITALAGGLVGGIVVSLAAGIVIGMFICKKKNRTEQASSHMSEMKKGKKNSKEVNPVEADVTVMMPGHQMSQMTTGNLTAAIVASNPTPSIPSP